jgi:hypothetical protein
MTRALLDHPWPLDEGLQAGSAGFDVLRRFNELVREFDLTPAPFIEPDEYHQCLQRLNVQAGGPRVAALRRFASQLVRYDPGAATAAPRPEPPLGDAWKRALRAELETGEDWRVPQIVFPRSRASVWPNAPEVEIVRAGTEPEHVDVRVLVSLEDFGAHRYAIADVDPWRNQEWLNAPAPAARIDHPCRLPRPPALEGVQLDAVAGHLEDVSHQGWEAGGLYHFIPPTTFDPNEVPKDRWRHGRAFAVQRTPDKQRQGALDCEGRIWVWDHAERHWDVQLREDYARISHDGRAL